MRFNEKLVGVLLIAVGFGGLLMSRQEAEKPSSSILPTSRATGQALSLPDGMDVESKRVSCKVLTVYDGDTLGCDLDGDGEIERPTEEIRLLGIDSPEMHYSRKNPTYGTKHPTDEPFAKQASQWLQTHAQGKQVWLVFDLRKHDKYGRSLAHVFAKPEDAVSLNQQEVALGYATTLFIGKNRLYEQEYLEAEHQARQAKRGLWGHTDP